MTCLHHIGLGWRQVDLATALKVMSHGNSWQIPEILVCIWEEKVLDLFQERQREYKDQKLELCLLLNFGVFWISQQHHLLVQWPCKLKVKTIKNQITNIAKVPVDLQGHDGLCYPLWTSSLYSIVIFFRDSL